MIEIFLPYIRDGVAGINLVFIRMVLNDTKGMIEALVDINGDHDLLEAFIGLQEDLLRSREPKEQDIRLLLQFHNALDILLKGSVN